MITFEIISAEGPIGRYDSAIQTTAKLWPSHACPPLTLRGIFVGRDYVVIIVVEHGTVTYDETPGVLANGMIVDDSLPLQRRHSQPAERGERPVHQPAVPAGGARRIRNRLRRQLTPKPSRGLFF